MTIACATRLLRALKLTSTQLCQHSYNLAVFGENSLCLNAYAKLLSLDEILTQAQQSNERIQNGKPKSDLDGIPVTIKANIAVGKYWELPNACSNILSQGKDAVRHANHKLDNNNNNNKEEHNYVYESDISRIILRDCGAVLIGITNMDEFGMGSLGTNNALGQNATTILNREERLYPHTYNPIPWLQRIALLDDSQQQQLLIGDGIDDEIWLKRILDSTSSNPHGIRDEKSLSKLLEEVQYWTCGENVEQTHSLNDDSPLISPGGSSSGAAVAASHGSCLLSIGTDTGGSLRLPAAWTSTVGFKPTYGTWSRYGVINYASSLDTVGFVTRTTECAVIAWRCLRSSLHADESRWSGQLSRDSTAMVYHVNKKTSKNDDRSFSEIESKKLVNIRIGIPAAFSLEETPPHIASAWSESASILQNVGGATLVAISDSKLSSELIKTALASYYVLACAEASSNLSRYDGVRYGMNVDFNTDPPESSDFHSLSNMSILERQISTTRAYRFGEETQRRILAGTSILSSDRFHTHYEAAALARAMLSQSLNNVFRPSLHDNGLNIDGVDVILVPTALTFPPKLCPIRDNKIEMMDPTAAFANDVMTIPFSLGGLPSISVPASRKVSVEGASSIGMQIVASRGSEDLILRVANVLDRC